MAPSASRSGGRCVRHWQKRLYGQVLIVILRVGPGSLVCSSVTVDALQLLEMNRDLPPVGGAFGVEDKGGFGSGGHLSMN